MVMTAIAANGGNIFTMKGHDRNPCSSSSPSDVGCADVAHLQNIWARYGYRTRSNRLTVMREAETVSVTFTLHGGLQAGHPELQTRRLNPGWRLKAAMVSKGRDMKRRTILNEFKKIRPPAGRSFHPVQRAHSEQVSAEGIGVPDASAPPKLCKALVRK